MLHAIYDFRAIQPASSDALRSSHAASPELRWNPALRRQPPEALFPEVVGLTVEADDDEVGHATASRELLGSHFSPSTFISFQLIIGGRVRWENGCT